MDNVRKPDPGAKLMQGNEACSEGAIAAGCRFFAGYPITPASEIAERLSVRLPQVDGTFIQMEDEIASMGAIIGASLAGGEVHDRHLGAGVFAHAGEPGLCLHGRGALRGGERDARGSQHRPSHQPLPGGRDAGPLGDPRGPPHHRAERELGSGMLSPYREGVQLRGKIPHSR